MPVKSIALTLALLLSGVSAASAEPISVLGISWKNSPKEMVEILTSRGFVCSDKARYERPVSVQCKFQNSFWWIYINDTAISIDCHILDICEMEAEHVAKRFEETGKTGYMMPRTTARSGANMITEYCGTGSDQDFACVETGSFSHQTNRLVVYKGEYRGKINFD